jgi:hypothetical protein
MPLPRGFHDSFAEEGLWWLPGREAHPVAGTVSFDPSDGATLKLLGFLNDGAASFGAMVDLKAERATIFGVTKKGRPVSIIGAINQQRQMNMPGISVETWVSGLMVIGFHLTSDADEEIFTTSFFRFEAIERWLASKAFDRKHSADGRTLSLDATAAPLRPFASHRDFELSTVGSLYATDTTDTHYQIDVFSQLALTPVMPKSLNWHLKRAKRVQELASLCMGHFLPLTHFELRGPTEDFGGFQRPVAIHVFAQLVHPEGGKRGSGDQPLVSGPELVAINPQAVQLWFDQYELFDPAISLFFTISSPRHMFTNVRFLLAVQALEVFHRRTSDAAPMPAADFKAFAKELVDAIPDSGTLAMKEKLRGTYQFINELSLTQRLKAIIRDLETELGSRPVAFPKDILRKYVETRNYYTHFSENLRDKCLDGGGMYWGTRRIILLLTILFLRRIGVPAPQIIPLLERHREFSRLWATSGIPR